MRILVTAIVFLFTACSGFAAENTAAPIQPAPVASSDEVITTEIFRRTPLIDGSIVPGEWDLFISPRASAVSVYANWDSNGLYAAVQADSLDSIELSFDINNDGWYHNNDNLLITISNLAENRTPDVKAQVYDSKAAKNSREAGFSIVPVSGLIIKTSASEAGTAVEIAVPNGTIKGLNPRPNLHLGFRAAVGKAGALIPSSDPGAVLRCTLVETKTAVPDNLEMDLEILDKKVTPGQELNAKVTFKNKSKENISASYFVIGGEGRAAKLMDSEKRMIPNFIKPNQRIKHNYNSVILPALAVGSWAIGVELRNADDSRIAAGLAAFEVVEPFVFFTKSSGDARKSAVAETKVKVSLQILNNTNRPAFGKVRLSAPPNWRVLPKIEMREFAIRGEDQITDVQYDLFIPNSEAPGNYDLKFDVLVGSETYSVTHRIAFPLTVAAGKELPPRPAAEP